MIKLYMLVGFLGAGKTTLLKNLIDILKRNRIKVIVNEFGSEGIDGELIKQLDVAVSEINNGSIFCSCRIDEFEQALFNSIKENPEVIIVEASGLSDPSHVKNILSKPSFESIEFSGCICVADATSLKKVISTARVCKKQLAVSDIVLINKTDIASDEDIEETENLVRQSSPARFIYRTAFGRILPEWLDSVADSKPPDEGAATYHLKDVSLQKMSVHIKDSIPQETLEKILRMFIEDTYRVKGFVRTSNGSCLIDCVGASLKISPYRGSVTHSRIVALAGADMPMEQSIRRAAQWYPQYIEKISWDK